MISICLWGETGKMGKTVLDELGHFRSFKKEEKLEKGEGVIDFSSPQGTVSLLKKLDELKSTAWVVSGTTGFSEKELQILNQASTQRKILLASNFSLGVFALKRALRVAWSLLEDESFSVSIIEKHHVHKKDSPSGTAKSLRTLFSSEVSIQSIREKDEVGTHEVMMKSDFEELSFIHRAKSRRAFTQGALRAALELHKKILKKEGLLPSRLLTLEDLF